MKKNSETQSQKQESIPLYTVIVDYKGSRFFTQVHAYTPKGGMVKGMEQLNIKDTIISEDLRLKAAQHLQNAYVSSIFKTPMGSEYYINIDVAGINVDGEQMGVTAIKTDQSFE